MQPKFFHVLFQGQTADEGASSSSSEMKVQRKSGFTINWFLKESNGSRLTEILPARAEDWKPEEPTANQKQPLFHEMVKLAQYRRIKYNMTGQQVSEKVIEEKMENIH